MKRLCLLLSAAALLALSCHKTYIPAPQQPGWDYAWSFHKDSQIDTTMFPGYIGFSEIPGSNYVFSYTQSFGMSDSVIDNEYSASLVFQVSNAVNSFSYSGNGMATMLSHYRGGGAWSYYEPVLLNNGTISGTKTDATHWYISINVTLPLLDDHTGVQHIVVERTFVLVP